MFLLNLSNMNRSSNALVPLTAIEFEILLSLASGALHGYAILQDIDQRTGGRVAARPGTLYRAVSRLLGAGLLAESTDAARAREDPRRRTYRLTPEGRRVAALEAQRLQRQIATARARKVLRSEG